MQFHLCEHIYLTEFRDELIIFDIKRDKYTICFKEIADLLARLFVTKQVDSGGCLPLPNNLPTSAQDLERIQILLDHKIIEIKNTVYPFYIDSKLDSGGVSNIDWSLPLSNKHIPCNFQVLKALITLVKVNFYIKFVGFYATIQLIKKNKDLKINYIIPLEQDLKDLADILNKACLIYPKKTASLEWAITFVLLALQRSWQCNLVIGVQNYPFFSHAWVECDGKVIIDSQELSQGLAIILNEPFRKLKL